MLQQPQRRGGLTAQHVAPARERARVELPPLHERREHNVRARQHRAGARRRRRCGIDPARVREG
eukprot:6115182-Prymnesium_polylepis.1